MLQDVLGDAADWRARGHQLHLNFARGDQPLHEAERLSDHPSNRQQAVKRRVAKSVRHLDYKKKTVGRQ